MHFNVRRYQLNPDPDGKFPYTIYDQQVENTHTSLNLLGKGAPNYSQYIADNYVWLLENFAGTVAPINPISGQLWYNTAENTIYLRTINQTWVPLNSGTTFTDLTDGPGTIEANSILVGNSTGTALTYIPAPTVPNTSLYWNGTTFVWSTTKFINLSDGPGAYGTATQVLGTNGASVLWKNLKLTELSDTPPGYGTIGQVLTSTGTAATWQTPSTSTVGVEFNGVSILTDATSINFLGGVAVTANGSVAEVTVTGGSSYPTSITDIGTISAWPSNTWPVEYLPCDGSAVSRVGYPDLFDVIGTSFGAGDGSTTFNLPNMNARTIIGSGQTNVTSTFTYNIPGTYSYTVPNNVTQIIVEVWGAGGGGSAGRTSSNLPFTAPTSGTASSFGYVIASGGLAPTGITNTYGGAGGMGGIGSNGDVNNTGNNGGNGSTLTTGINIPGTLAVGGSGGNAGGSGGTGGAGGDGSLTSSNLGQPGNFPGGGGGGTGTSGALNTDFYADVAGAGGGGGGYSSKTLTVTAGQVISLTVGSGGIGGTLNGTRNGGAGANGLVIIQTLQTTNSYTLAELLGEETHTLSTSELPSHGHSANSGLGLFAVTNSVTSQGFSSGTDSYSKLVSQTDFTGGGYPHNNIQPSIVLNWLIKALPSGIVTVGVEQNGTSVVSAVTDINFTGNVNVTASGSVATVNIPVPVISSLNGITSFMSAGNHTYTVPSNVTKLWVKLWGGGGGATPPVGASGAGGGYSEKLITVTPGQSISVTVGAGGIGVAIFSLSTPIPSSANGGTTSFGSYFSASGGPAGLGNTNGGIGIGGDLNLQGGNGVDIDPQGGPFPTGNGTYFASGGNAAGGGGEGGQLTGTGGDQLPDGIVPGGGGAAGAVDMVTNPPVYVGNGSDGGCVIYSFGS